MIALGEKQEQDLFLFNGPISPWAGRIVPRSIEYRLDSSGMFGLSLSTHKAVAAASATNAISIWLNEPRPEQTLYLRSNDGGAYYAGGIDHVVCIEREDGYEVMVRGRIDSDLIIRNGWDGVRAPAPPKIDIYIDEVEKGQVVAPFIRVMSRNPATGEVKIMGLVQEFRLSAHKPFPEVVSLSEDLPNLPVVFVPVERTHEGTAAASAEFHAAETMANAEDES